MLKELYIKNLALFSEQHIIFGKGLNVITGETGSGKSLLLKSLALLRGDKANADWVRQGRAEAQIVASIEISQDQSLTKLLESLEIATAEELTIRRVVKADGKNKVFVNDVPITLNGLNQIGQYLFHLTRQHEYQRLTDKNFAIRCLDEFSKNDNLLQTYDDLQNQYRENLQQLETLKVQHEQSLQQEEFLRFQLHELSKINLKPNEEAELEQEKLTLKNASKLALGFENTLKLLDGPQSVTEQLAKVIKELTRLQTMLPMIESELHAMDNMQTTFLELTDKINQWSANITDAPARLDAIESRLAAIADLKRKHRCDFTALLQLQNQIQEKLARIEHFTDVQESLQLTKQKIETEILKIAQTLHQQREKFAPQLAKLIVGELKDLGLTKARCELQIEYQNDLQQLNSRGLDKISFLISMNPGQDLMELAKVASGGELSRILLALRQVLYPKNFIGTLVFDEIDQGIGGAVSQLVGAKLKQLAKNHQVICVTHLSQIAAYGDHHLKVEKTFSNKETFSLVNQIKDKLQVEEIARMLTGVTVSENAIKHAAELIKQSA